MIWRNNVDKRRKKPLQKKTCVHYFGNLKYRLTIAFKKESQTKVRLKKIYDLKIW